MAVAPTASAFELFETACTALGNRVVIALNPQLEDAAVGIGRVARARRAGFLSTWQVVYGLYPMDQCVLARSYPGSWCVFREDAVDHPQAVPPGPPVQGGHGDERLPRFTQGAAGAVKWLLERAGVEAGGAVYRTIGVRSASVRGAVMIQPDPVQLDQLNPRQFGRDKAASDAAMIADLYRSADLEELLQSISANGYMDIELSIVLGTWGREHP